jgi:hypothetical protein
VRGAGTGWLSATVRPRRSTPPGRTRVRPKGAGGRCSPALSWSCSPTHVHTRYVHATERGARGGHRRWAGRLAGRQHPHRRSVLARCVARRSPPSHCSPSRPLRRRGDACGSSASCTGCRDAVHVTSPTDPRERSAMAAMDVSGVVALERTTARARANADTIGIVASGRGSICMHPPPLSPLQRRESP